MPVSDLLLSSKKRGTSDKGKGDVNEYHDGDYCHARHDRFDVNDDV